MPSLKAPFLPALLGASCLLFAQTPEDPRALLIQGRALQRWMDDDPAKGAAKALPLFRKAATLEPQSAEAHLRLSEALMDSGDLTGALAPALQAVELAPQNGEAWLHLGVLQHKRAEKLNIEEAWPQAQKALLKAATILGTDSDVWAWLAQVAQMRKDDTLALKAWIRVGRLHSQRMSQGRTLSEIGWAQAAALAIRLNNYEARREAVLALCQVKYPDPQALRMLEDLAKDQVEKGFLGHGEESFALLGRYYPNEAAVWDNVALIQLRTGRFDEAILTLQRAESLRPSPRGNYFSALCLMNLGRFQEAEPRWRQALLAKRFTKDDEQLAANARTLLATALVLDGRPQAALDAIQEWPEADSRPELLSLKVQALVQTKNWKQALQALRDGMARFPDQAIFQAARTIPPERLVGSLFTRQQVRQTLSQLNLEAMAGLHGEFRRWERCLDYVNQARKAAPVRGVELLLLQGNALQELGRMDEAMAVLREGQRMNPGHPMLQNNLGYLLLEHGGDVKEAAALIEAALKQDPANGSTMDSWGWALFRQGRFKEAEESLRKANELSPYSPEIRKHWGDALLSLGRLEEALEQWERALAYAFPDRKALEQRARELRIRIAKKQAESVAVETETPAATDPDLDEEDL